MTICRIGVVSGCRKATFVASDGLPEASIPGAPHAHGGRGVCMGPVSKNAISALLHYTIMLMKFTWQHVEAGADTGGGGWGGPLSE